MNRLRQTLCASAAIAIGVLSMVGTPSVAAAASVPFTDKNVHGSLGFCDKTGHEIKSGPLNVAPFVWFAASNAAAPSQYANGGKATLYAFQPIKDEDPGLWSGRQLTGSSSFSNARVPMASGTVLDPALEDFVSAFPPKIDNLVQLRMYFNSAGAGLYRTTYPAAVLRVTATTWTLVQGGGVNCKAGTAVSSELAALPASAFATPPRATPPANAPIAARNPQSSTSVPGASSSGAATSGSATDSTTPAGNAAAHNSDTGGSNGAIAGTVVAVVVVAGAGAGWWFWRRRRITP